MSKIKSLILGSAAIIAASAGAQAADLPVKAKAVQYVKICSLYGAGFYYIPGTDTCIKLGGYTQVDVNFAGGNYNQPSWSAASGTNVAGRNGDYYTTRARNQLNVDTRTATEYGVVRTFWVSNFEFSSGAQPSTGNLTVDYGFIQFAGFTFGKAVSGFNTPWGAFGGNNNTSFLLGGADNATGITQIAYTWQFGNGISAQIGAEDNRQILRGTVFNVSAPYAAGAAANALMTGAIPSAYGGNAAPDIVGNVRWDSAAATFQISGAAHQVHANYNNPADERQGAPEDKWGGAVSAGIQLKNLPTGPGDKLSLDGTYSKGAVRYIISGTTPAQTGLASFGTSGLGYQSFAAVNAIDAVFGTGNKLELTDAWGFRGAYVHNWSPTWESSVFGSYTKVDFNGQASALICNNLATIGVKQNGYTCNPDFAIYQIGTRTGWTPVRNLTFSAEVLYTVIDQSYTGTTSPGGAISLAPQKPNVAYEYKDQGIVSGNIRVRRTW